LAHLKNKHQIDYNADNLALPTDKAAYQATITAGVIVVTTITTKAVREAYGLVTTVNAARFRHSLIQFIVMCSIAFSVVESPYFQVLLESCSYALTPFFVKAGNTVKR